MNYDILPIIIIAGAQIETVIRLCYLGILPHKLNLYNRFIMLVWHFAK